MALSDLYAQPQAFPELLERGKANRIRCPVYEPGGGLATVVSGTVTITDGSGTAIVDAQAVSVDGDGAYYDVGAGSLSSSLTFADGWQIVWALSISGEVRRFDRDAALVPRRLVPVIVDQDVIGSLAGEGGSHALATIAGSDRRRGVGLRPEREEAWLEIQVRLLSVDRWPSLILNPWALRTAHIELTRSKVYMAAGASLTGADFRQMAADHHELYEVAWSRLTLVYDQTGDGKVSDNADGRVGGRRPTALGTYQPRATSTTAGTPWASTGRW